MKPWTNTFQLNSITHGEETCRDRICVINCPKWRWIIFLHSWNEENYLTCERKTVLRSQNRWGQEIILELRFLEKSSRSLCLRPISAFIITLDSPYLSSDWTTCLKELDFSLSWFAPWFFCNIFLNNIPRKIACTIKVWRFCMFEMF